MCWPRTMGSGMEFRGKPTDKKFIVKWAAVEKRIGQMVAEGSYLTPAELEKYQSDHLETAPPVSRGITNMGLDKILIDDWGAEGRKQRIFAQYQQGHSDKEIAVFLREEYLRGRYNDKNSGFVQLADGSRGYSYFVAAELRLRRRDEDGPMRNLFVPSISPFCRMNNNFLIWGLYPLIIGDYNPHTV